MTFLPGNHHGANHPAHGDRHPLPHQHGPAELLADHEVLTADHRSVRNLDGSIGIPIDRDTPERLDVADTNDHVHAAHHAKVTALDNDLV